jgi:serine/threonine protein kinase
VIDYTDRDHTPVLLVMERLKRDLYAALRNRLDFSIRLFEKKSFSFIFSIKYFCRMSIALDVVEGLRYLHGLGLVHRDIKLKNVLVNIFLSIFMKITHQIFS